MSGTEVRRIRRSLRLSQAAFARLLRVTPLTVSRWERDDVRVTDPMALLIELAAEKATKERQR